MICLQLPLHNSAQQNALEEKFTFFILFTYNENLPMWFHLCVGMLLCGYERRLNYWPSVLELSQLLTGLSVSGGYIEATADIITFSLQCVYRLIRIHPGSSGYPSGDDKLYHTLLQLILWV